MKKTLLAAIITASMVSGCSLIPGNSDAVSYKELQTTGAELAERSDAEHYQPSTIQEAEIVRLTINTAFLAAKPAYERYTQELLATPAVGNYFAAVESVDSEEEKKAIYDALSEENKKAVDEFMASSVFDEIMGGLKEAAVPAMKSAATFLTMDTTSLLAGLDFSAIPAEKDKFELTYEQLDYLNDTVVSAYNNYKVVSAFSTAQ